ncbi:MAG: enoyl-CoA hydratase [Actinobacteria bacterium]|nr:enoyl-CoA hydratase [Actinomycetota bacterium]
MTTDPRTAALGDPLSVVHLEVSDRIATVRLNRPEARNALSTEVITLLEVAMAAADADTASDVIILTGSDPAFSAGLDLKELGSTGDNLRAGGASGATAARRGPWAPTRKPVIGAINGVAVTGGFELALNCDFLVASDRARFADTHARVGVMPGWGLTVLLAEAVGVRRARELSYTGNFLTADRAFAWGLVNHVVVHDDLLPFTRKLATDIAGNDARGVQRMRATYTAVTDVAPAEGWMVEARMGREWAAGGIDPAAVEARRQRIVERGRSQL